MSETRETGLFASLLVSSCQSTSRGYDGLAGWCRTKGTVAGMSKHKKARAKMQKISRRKNRRNK